MLKLGILAQLLVFLLASAAPVLAQESTPPTTAENLNPPTASIRVAHLSPDAPPMNITINGEPTGLQTAAYLTVTDWLELPIGLYTFAATSTAESVQVMIGPAELSFTRNARITVAIIGSLEDATLTGNLIAEDYTTPIPQGDARLTLYHAAAETPDIDLRLADGAVLAEGVRYTAKVIVDAAAVTTDIQVVESGTGNVLLELQDTTIEAGAYYLLAVTGAPGSLQAGITWVEQN